MGNPFFDPGAAPDSAFPLNSVTSITVHVPGVIVCSLDESLLLPPNFP